MHRRLVIEIDFDSEYVSDYTKALEVIKYQVARLHGDIPCSGECGELHYGARVVGSWAVIDVS